MTARPGIEYLGLSQVQGPLIFVKGIRNVGFREMAEVESPDGEVRLGRVLSVSEDLAVVEIFEGTVGLSAFRSKVRFLGHPFEYRVSSEEVLGRVFDGLGRPLDGGPMPLLGKARDINGLPINPVARVYPQDFIQTGISAIDGLNALVRGQKLPVFSGSGLPHAQLAAQIVRQAKLLEGDEKFAVVFAAVGIKHEEAQFFRKDFEESGGLKNVSMFLNLADDPSIERLITPRIALTVAEHLAFEEEMHVLVVLSDMTNYCEALREVATSKGEVPSRKGYPGYLYSDLASIYERAGRIATARGSITQIPILTMPDDDITHPIPDLTGYITEGQIVLDRGLFQKGIYPPINILPSLSRLMSDGIGEGRTREDHQNLASQIYALYAQAKRVEMLASIIGEEDLTAHDRLFLKFSQELERRFIGQEPYEDRPIFETLDLGWELAMIFPERDLSRVKPDQIREHGLRKGAVTDGKTAPVGQQK
ncbi:V-type ATP synthase subunit B [Desulforhabdus amnigena]|uniref:V-type ATP synthase beta chain n=1 Tax=Desulforhabdus amnigena TaxID=40218 RepID=A0A9W6CZQ6_9BACT|nr:V-type ATP synthase subunit B [Desulforhabdus amnigena]GLI34756.1 V-type ATP synthase subunit B [Desulforhabdus amnigena]